MSDLSVLTMDLIMNFDCIELFLLSGISLQSIENNLLF